MIQVRVEADVRAVSVMFEAMRRNLSNLEPTLRQAAGVMREDVLKQFQQGGNPDWKPLAASTIARKKGHGYPRLTRGGIENPMLMQNGDFNSSNILIRTGSLLSSWTQEGDSFHVEEITGNSAEIGSSMPYAIYHQSDEPRKRLPKRAVRVTEDAQAQIASLIEKAIVKEES